MPRRSPVSSSEVRDRVQGVELRPTGDPEDDRWRLLQAITSFLKNASTVQPLMILLEDLHWADRGTLDLLLHVARNLQGARLMLVGTYRDVEVDRSHPLSGALAELRRITGFSRIPLRGLTPDEVQRMMAGVAQREIPWAFAELVHRQTEGNPLFIQEMLRYLVEEGLVAEQGGALQRVGDEPLAGRIPEGLRDVIGKRLSRLADRTNQLLSVASVIGREFRLDVLQKVAGLPEEELITALEEATEVAVIEERSSVGATVTYRFTHAFFRQTLYEELSAPRRIRWHQQVARALEEVHARRLNEHAVELAEHFSNSSDPADLAKAVRYGEMAAERAMSVFDYGEASRLLERALDVQEVLDPDDKAKRCDLLLALGEALIPAGEPLRAVEHIAEEVFNLADLQADRGLATRACRLGLDGLRRYGSTQASITSTFRQWAERAAEYAEAGTADQVEADLALADAIGANEKWAEAYDKRRQALGLARGLEDSERFFRAARSILATPGALDWLAELKLADEVIARKWAGVSTGTLAYALAFAGRVSLSGGNRTQAERVWQAVEELTARTRAPDLMILPLLNQGILATVDGRLEEAVVIGENIRSRANETGTPMMGELYSRVALRPLLYLGMTDAALSLYMPRPDSQGGDSAAGRALRAICLIQSARQDEARQLLRSFMDSHSADELVCAPVNILGTLLEVAVLLMDATTAKELFDFIGERSAPVMFMPAATFSRRILGAASALLGNPEEARAYYAQGLEVCEKVRFRPEIALIRLDLAELLLAHYPDERNAAIEHLDFAIAEFREMKMQPSLERALRHRGLLKA